jgi:hypothetical protein
MASEGHKTAVVRSSTKLSTKTICKAKSGVRTAARLLVKRIAPHDRPAGAVHRVTMREESSARIGGQKVPAAAALDIEPLSRPAARPPGERFQRRASGDRQAIGDRPFGWLGKATGVPCEEGDRVDALRRDPPPGRHAGTRTSRPTRRPAGGRPRPAAGRDAAPAPCGLRRHDRGAVRCDRQEAGHPCVHAPASGVPVPTGTADAGLTARSSGGLPPSTPRR